MCRGNFFFNIFDCGITRNRRVEGGESKVDREDDDIFNGFSTNLITRFTSPYGSCWLILDGRRSVRVEG